jgi:hypothetical protein
MRPGVSRERISEARVEFGRRGGESERLKHGRVFRRALRHDENHHLVAPHLQ